MNRLLKRLVMIIITIILVPLLALLWLTSTETGLRWTYNLLYDQLPAGLNIGTLKGNIAGPIKINDLYFEGQGYLIEVRQLIIDWRPGSLLGGVIDINQFQINDISVSLPSSPDIEQETSTVPDIQLPWHMKIQGAVVNGLTVNHAKQSITIPQIKLDANSLFSNIDIEKLELINDVGSLRISGNLNPTRDYQHDLNLTWRYRLLTDGELIGVGQIKGDANVSELKQRIDGPLQLSINGQVNELISNLHWNAIVKGSSSNIAFLQSDLPEVKAKLQLKAKGDLKSFSLIGTFSGDNKHIGPIDAEFDLGLSEEGNIDISKLNVSVENSDTHIKARGHWQPNGENGIVDIALNWQNLRWPIEENAWFNSTFGSGWIKGTPEQYSFGISTDRPWHELPPSHWMAAGSGNLNEIDFHSLRISTLEGEVNNTGSLSWNPELTWNANTNLNGINPAVLFPDWNGNLGGKIFFSGSYINQHLVVDADIQQIKGRLRDHSLTMQSRLTWHGDSLDINSLEVQSGTSHIKMHGLIAQDIQLNFTLDSNNLDELYPNVSGQLSAHGQLTGNKNTPSILTTLKGKNLHIPGHAGIEAIEGSINFDPMQWQETDIQLSANELHIEGYQFEKLELAANDSTLLLKTRFEKTYIDLLMSGKAEKQTWQGSIETANIQNEHFGPWELNTPTPLSITHSELNLESLCLNNRSSQLCSNINFQNNQWQSQFTLKELPLHVFGQWIPPDLTLEGIANGKANFSYSETQGLEGTLNIIFPSSTVSYPLLEGERNEWRYRGGTLDAEINKESIKAVTAFTTERDDHILLRAFSSTDGHHFADPANQNIEAEAQIKIQDLTLVEALLDEVQDLKGEINLQLNATGTLSQPRLSGVGKLDNGSLRIPRLGITLRQLRAEVHSQEQENINYQLDAESGEGYLSLKGRTILDQKSGWPTSFTVKGENFEVSRIPEARMEISPDLSVDVKDRTINTEGKVHIPYAKLQPKDISTASRVSEDTVIIGGQQTPSDKWKMISRIRLSLGERVNFYGFGFEGRFGGNILLVDEPGGLTKATGELNVPEGRYRAYGQRLDVEHGRLIYTGSPINNPGLDFRSVRRTGNVTAGLKVRGTLNQPIIELYSNPAMGQTDALSYLLLGRPIENASDEEGAMMAKATLALGIIGGDRLARSIGDRFGLDEMRVDTSDTDDQASLVIGRYLSPKLYISYGVGLIEAVNTLNVRYQISEKWQLKGESGEHQGADLFYTIEK